MEKRIDTKSGSFLIRPYRQADSRDVHDLWKTAFGKDINPLVWDWKYEKNPFGRRILLCVDQSGKPVVMFAALPYRALWRGEQVLIMHAVDNMSHPDYRGAISGRKGLFVKTADCFFEQYAGPDKSVFVYGFPGERHFRLGRITLDYAAIPGGAAYMEALPGRLVRGVRLFAGKIRLESSPGIEFDMFAESMSRDYPFTVFRGSKFLQWRFFEHPSNDYLFFSYRSLAGRLKGYAVTRVQDEDLLIIDMMLHDSRRLLPDFFGRMLKSTYLKDIKKVKVWLPGGHFLAENAAKEGFSCMPEPLGFIPAFVSRSFHPKFDNSRAVSRIYYTMADGDLF